MLAAAPLILGALALAFARGDTARQAARITLGGVSFTPALLVPFAFAPALGVLLGGRAFRGVTIWAVGLTALTVLVLVGQKEIGYTGVCLGVAAVTFLIARGNLLQLAAGGVLGVVGLGLAFELQPLMPIIPFTVRERILMWLGGAPLARRGGHLLIADRVTYDVGGYHGVGIHSTLGFEPVQVVNSLDTDFPLATLGLYGGFPWLLAYVVLFVLLTVLLYDVARRQARFNSRRERYRLAVLVGLASVPVASTVINVSGGLTHLTPFAGVPAAFLSYGTFFLGGTIAIVLVFFVASQRRALAMRLKERALHELRLDELAEPTAPPLAADPTRLMAPEPWWRNRSWAGFKLFIRRRVARFRVIGVDGGATAVIGAVIALGVLWTQTLHARFTDRPQVHTHPALSGESVRLRPLAPGIWETPVDPDEPEPPTGWAGVMEDDETYRLGPLEFTYRDGYLLVRGGCWSFAKATVEGVSVGFEGLLDASLGDLSALGARLTESLGVSRERANDLVLPLSPVALRHILVTRLGSDQYRVEALSSGRFVVYDAEGLQLTPPRRGSTVIRAGYSLGLADDERLRFELMERPDSDNPLLGEVCLINTARSVFQWRLSRWKDTLIGGPELLRRAPVERSVDFEFAEDIKRAAEGHVIGLNGGRLRVTPWDPSSRATWDPLTRKRFSRIFRVRRERAAGGGTSEVLHWIRQFYRNGDTRVRFDDARSVFARGWGGDSSMILGLRDPYRFSRRLPARTRTPAREEGELLDRRGLPLARFDREAGRWRTAVQGAGTLIGYGFADRGIYGGLLRVFRKLLHGRPVRTRTLDEALSEKVLNRDLDLIGVNVQLTLDGELQRRLQTIVDEEARALWELALAAGDVAWRPRARLLVLGQDNAILGAASHPSLEPHSLRSVMRASKAARVSPYEAAGLDTWHRTTTVGSTAKIGVLVAAAREPEVHFRDYGRDQLCINAEGDEEYSDRQGCFVEKGILSSFRGQPIAALFNYGNSYIGGVTTVRRLIMKSENTSASYLAGRIGLDGLRDYYAQLGASGPGTDLLPMVLGRHPRFGVDIERWPRDALMASPARLGQLPRGEEWRLDYTVRLALSGFSDLNLLHVGMSAAIAARDGRHYPPFLVMAMRDLRDGQRVAVNPPPPLQVIPVRVARHLKSSMVATVRAGTAIGIKRYLRQGGLYAEVGAKTGTAETVRLDPAAEQRADRRKLRTQDHKFAAGFWPSTTREPFVVVAAFEYASHLDRRVALRMMARTIQVLSEIYPSARR